MHDTLHSAKNLAERIRYAGDCIKIRSIEKTFIDSPIKNLFNQNSIKIVHEVTPSLNNKLNEVLNNLLIPKSSVEAFVYQSPDIQAECYAGSTSQCVIRFSSALVEILSEDEFSFVAGHELGHFLFCHSVVKGESCNENIEFYIQQRSQEISADRIGLIACGSLDIAIKALMKTVSGLSSKHIRFDVGAFIAQLKNSSTIESLTTSHPSILVRSRALLWFSLNNDFVESNKNYKKNNIIKIDDKIKNDMDKYVDGKARNLIDKARFDLSIWIEAYNIVNHGTFDRNEQIIFEEKFGLEILDKLITFFKSMPASELKFAVNNKLIESRNYLEKLIPDSFDNEYKKICEQFR